MIEMTSMDRREAITRIVGATTGGLIIGNEAHSEEKRVLPAKFDYDVVIVGGGPSGLTVALVLGRACRRVLVCDEGKPRNHTSPAVHFDNGERLELSALFVRTTMVQRSPLPSKLGCKLTSMDGGFKDAVEVDQFGATSVPGLYVVGDASRGMPQVATAVSDASLAAVMANKAMIKEDAERA